MKFFEYNFDTGEVIRYERQGECCHCGECCTTRIDFHTSNYKFRGVWACVTEDGLPDFWQQVARISEIGGEVCQQYTGSGCGIYPDRLRMCRTWPMTPAQVALFPHCSYTFEVVERGSIGVVDI